MTLRYDIIQRSPEWHRWRETHLGSSEIASLFGVQSDFAMSAFTLHQVKAGIIPPPPVESGPGSRVWFGVKMEPIIVEMAAELYKWPSIRFPGPYAIDDQCAGMAASLDALILEPGPEEAHLGFRGPGVLEVKRSEWLAHSRAYTNNEPPYQVILQCQHGAACAGVSWGVVVVLVGELGLLSYRYAARPGTASVIRNAVTRFWEDVRNGTPPNPDHTASSSAALREMFPARVDAPALDLMKDTETDVTAAAFLIAGAHRKESNKIYDGQRNLLKWRLKEATQAETENHWISGAPDKNGTVRIRVWEKKRT